MGFNGINGIYMGFNGDISLDLMGFTWDLVRFNGI
jgi:hypothetical protein